MARVVKEAKTWEFPRAREHRFPTFAVILLVVGVIWLLNELNVIAVKIPWIPIVLVIVALGMIINRYTKR